ncbi:tol-pal system-associated acyl-CoA thioesterase [Janthinobacterium sp. 17J80-10]|uniref:tol-pal system-associated acyl-CoA thioesterase n=1 Tax=Janthinobacterium sp. 17J80-10 TaxID=2497863 RepID=UPI0010057CA7|nr:tol-pal system-associated acyl-CoA thioesterase [Janthinobacterium sp. 17J80-10]QAU35258.1 tol-pal system-associated acyl-CoA thioesterase [Janthinobacterium sp. 17J80-10]
MSSEKDFSWTIRVYYEDTDAGGIVFYANYLKFFERARTEWLRHAGFSQHVLADTLGVLFVVKKTSVEYHAPAKLDDELKLVVVVERVGGASMQVRQEAWRVNEGEPFLLAEGTVTLVCVNKEEFRPRAIPDDIRLKINCIN